MARHFRFEVLPICGSLRADGRNEMDAPCYAQANSTAVYKEVERAKSSKAMDHDSDSSAESVAMLGAIPLDEDLYGVSIAAFLRDLRKLVTGHGNFPLRLSRLTVHIFLLMLLIATQFFLIYEMKEKVCPSEVDDLRQAYEAFEVALYGRGERPAHFDWMVNNTRIDPKVLDTLDSSKKDMVCSMPLAHPYFCFCILTIWTLTVFVDLRKLIFMSSLIALRIPTVPSLYHIFEHEETERHARPKRADGKVAVVGFTLGVKFVLIVFIILPRFIVDVALLWLGCRWLIATDNLQDALLNAVALEFIIMLKELVYLAVVPLRTKVEAQELLIPMNVVERANYGSYLGAFIWVVASLAWVACYMFEIQAVLPDYRWDARQVCLESGLH